MRRDAVAVVLGPRPLDDARRWMARVLACQVEGELVPVSVEVRMKARPCGHDEEPADQPEAIIWERSSCDCWPDSPWPTAEAVPPGGLPVRLLKNLRMGDFLGSWRQTMANAEQYGMTDHPVAGVAEHLQALAEGAKRGPSTRGRPKADPRLHLQRLEALEETRATGETRATVARRLGISPQTLSTSLRWAKEQDPPVWTSLGQGRAGHLTPHGRALIAAQRRAAKEQQV